MSDIEKPMFDYLNSYYRMGWWKNRNVEPYKYVLNPGSMMELPKPKNYGFRLYMRYPQIRKGATLELILIRPPFDFTTENVNVETLGGNKYRFTFSFNPYPSILTIDYRNDLYWIIATQLMSSGRIEIAYFVKDQVEV